VFQKNRLKNEAHVTSEEAPKHVCLGAEVETAYFVQGGTHDLDQADLVMTHKEVWDVFKEMTEVFALHDKNEKEQPWSVQDAVDALLFKIEGLLEEKVNASEED
jgi:hypothetical protein